MLFNNLFPLQSRFFYQLFFNKKIMKKIFIILLISNNLLAQDVLTESFGSENLETLNDSFSKKDLLKIEENKTQIARGSNPRNNRFGVNINMGSPTLLLSASLDYFITSSVNIEAGAGLLGAFGGMKYHFFGSKNTANWTPYLGLYIARNFTDVDAWFIEIFGSSSSSFKAINTNLYFPVGFQYISKYGFTFGAEFAGRILVPELAAAQIPFGGAIKFGYHFKTY